MPTRDSVPKSLPTWLELGTTDSAKSTAFYGALFGWTAESAGEEFGGYITFSLNDLPVAGCMQTDGTMGPDGWAVYLGTDDVAKVAETAPANGGQVLMPPMAVGDIGHMVITTDAGGAMIGGWQPETHKGFLIHNEPNAPGWFELHTRDFAGSLAFYREVFGCEIDVVSDADEFRYAIVMHDGLQWAGIMDATAFLPEGVPAHWAVYIDTADADATVAKAVGLGASVVQPVEDTPYGRLATLTDTTGATFKLVQPPAG